MLMEDVQELLQELDSAPSAPSMPEATNSSDQPMSSPRGTSQKREASSEAAGDRSRPKTDEDDILFCEEVLMSSCQSGETPTAEVLLSAFLQKRMQRELPLSGNDPELQRQIDDAKRVEWQTLCDKQAVRVHTGQKAQLLRDKHPSRFIGSRYVVVHKTEDESSRVKARWCLQGHLDPDASEKIQSGLCHSPTLSQNARALILQVLAIKGWMLCLGDIKGAFLEAGPLKPQFRPLFAKQPAGGIPGINPQDVIEVLGNVYGANDAPFNWYHTFDEGVRSIGFERSQFDNCLYYLRDSNQQLCAVLGAHVDDTIIGGSGPTYDKAVSALRAKFPYRKWRTGGGEFCGITYHQDPKTFEISYQQSEYARHLRPINLTKERVRDKEAYATDKEIAALRAVNGAANWLSSQTRPDLCIQTSMSQQCFPKPKVKDLVFANQLVHRARQYNDVTIKVRNIPWDKLGICFHSDAGFANAKGNATQRDTSSVLLMISLKVISQACGHRSAGSHTNFHE